MADTNFSPGTVVASTWLDDVNTNTYTILNTVAGTPDAITAVGPSTLVAYQRGVAMRLLPTAPNTGAVTINISGLGVRSITKYGTTPLVANDINTGDFAIIMYDGTQFQLINPQTTTAGNIVGTIPFSQITGTVPIVQGGTGSTSAPAALIALGATGRLVGVQTFIASGTYTPNALATRIVVVGQGAGGAGGGCGAVGAGQVGLGGGGAAGARGIAFITSGFTPTVAVTIGAGGTGVSGNAGNPGGASSFGAFLTLGGGGGGAAGATAAVSAGTGGITAAAGGSALLIASTGQSGSTGVASNASGYVIPGLGGSSDYGSGGVTGGGGGPTAPGTAAIGRSAGGGGAYGIGGGGAQAGGAGTGGVFIVYEYS